MNYKDAVNYIENRGRGFFKGNLDDIKKIMSELGDPQNNLKFIHIAGTNGKGTTISFISKILKDNGYKVGTTISPYIINFRERIQINGDFISEEDLISLVDEVRPIVDKLEKNNVYISQFALITAISFKYFYKQKCDIVCLETGIGGRFDPTNVIKDNIVSVICSISLDHVEMLGNSVDKIAYEKCGIIKENCTTILYPWQEKSVIDVVKNCVIEKKSKFILPDITSFKLKSSRFDVNYFHYKNKEYELKYFGEHLAKNAVVSIEIASLLKEKGFNINLDKLENSIYDTNLYGRMEKVLVKDINILLDGSHNEDGIKQLCGFIETLECSNKTAIVGVSLNKDIYSILDTLAISFNKIYITEFNSEKSFKSDEIKKFIKTRNYNIEIINYLDIDFLNLQKLNNSKLFVFCGSLYFISDVRNKYI
ncbi:MAG: bifunctional folylpolyglutamate synthase/dihydrofolate synthase [Oscillospiraceae bacterium]